MPLKKNYIRDGRTQIIGSVTRGYGDDSEVVRDSDNRIAGRTSGLFNTNWDRNGSITSVNSSDPGLQLPKSCQPSCIGHLLIHLGRREGAVGRCLRSLPDEEARHTCAQLGRSQISNHESLPPLHSCGHYRLTRDSPA